MLKPRFKIGDRVRRRVTSADTKDSIWRNGVITAVDVGHMVPQYEIDFGGGDVRRFRDDVDLQPDERVKTAEG